MAHFVASFRQKTLGKFLSHADIFLIKKSYKINLKLYGMSDHIEKKHFKTRGPECTADDFYMPKIDKKFASISSKQKLMTL